ncbi:MAG TPA: TMEM165/GDT1 family protein [Micromonosporaceae bacterium]|jgi:putative Ca2+/H+ antiporter (TMEM165/GDT1 family)|nr:TMEM165/GDT1 family protein [Micromonosporaceae bacterium]
MEYVVVALTAFGLIAPVELPDKTFVATLVLSTRYRPLPVWLGVIAAFAVQCLVAVAAGHLLSRLPQRPVALVAAALFAIGAGVLLRGARRADAAEAEQEQEYATKITDGRSGRRAAATSFAVLFTAEWGDLSQLLTAGLVASGQPAVPVFIGAWLALVTVSGAAVLLGRWLLRHVRLSVVRYVAAAVCASLALITLIDVIRG